MLTYRKKTIVFAFFIGYFFSLQNNKCCAESLPPLLFKVSQTGVYDCEFDKLELLQCNYTNPLDNVLPLGADVFNPIFGGSVVAGSPIISSITAQAGVDRSFIIQGIDLDTTVWIFRQTTTGNLRLYHPKIISKSTETIIATIDKNEPYGMYLVWVQNKKGISSPVRLNAANLWWLSNDKIQVGKELSIYGSNLTYQNGVDKSYVYLKPWGSGSSSQSIPCVVNSANPFKIKIIIPLNLQPQDYEVWVSNGHGGKYGFSGPLKINITTESLNRDGVEAFSGSIINVVNYGALPNDENNDDYPAIANAIAAAKDGDILYFPNGTYKIGSAISCSKSLYWKGENRENTFIRMLYGFDETKDMITFTQMPTAVCNLQFIDDSPTYSKYICQFRGYGRDPIINHTYYGCLVDNCVFNSVAKNIQMTSMYINNISNVKITNCTITAGRAVYATAVQRININHNTLYGNWVLADTNGPSYLSLWTCHKVDVSDNLGMSVDYSKPYISIGDKTMNRFFVMQSPYGRCSKIYVGNNTLKKVGHPSDNSGEQILFELSGTYTGQASSISDKVLQFSNVNWIANFFEQADEYFYKNPSSTVSGSSVISIVRGKGIGQHRTIVSNTTNSITIDKPWDIVPDLNSMFAIAFTQTETSVYNNNFDILDNGQYGLGNASCGVNVYGSMSDCFITNNTFKNCGTGIALFGKNFNSIVMPITNMIIDDNNISNCNIGLHINVGSPYITVAPGTPAIGSTLLNNIFRVNTIDRITLRDELNYSYLGGYGIVCGKVLTYPSSTISRYTWPGDWIKNQVFEYDTITNATTKKAYLRVMQTNTVFRYNNFGNESIKYDSDATKPDTIIYNEINTPITIINQLGNYCKINVVGKMIYVNFDNIIESQISLFNLYGQLEKRVKTYQLQNNMKVSKGGIYLVDIQGLNSRYVVKVLVRD